MFIQKKKMTKNIMKNDERIVIHYSHESETQKWLFCLEAGVSRKTAKDLIYRPEPINSLRTKNSGNSNFFKNISKGNFNSILLLLWCNDYWCQKWELDLHHSKLWPCTRLPRVERQRKAILHAAWIWCSFIDIGYKRSKERLR